MLLEVFLVIVDSDVVVLISMFFYLEILIKLSSIETDEHTDRQQMDTHT